MKGGGHKKLFFWSVWVVFLKRQVLEVEYVGGGKRFPSFIGGGGHKKFPSALRVGGGGAQKVWDIQFSHFVDSLPVINDHAVPSFYD